MNPRISPIGVYGSSNVTTTTRKVAVSKYLDGLLLKKGLRLRITNTMNDAETTDSRNQPVLNGIAGSGSVAKPWFAMTGYVARMMFRWSTSFQRSTWRRGDLQVEFQQGLVGYGRPMGRMAQRCNRIEGKGLSRFCFLPPAENRIFISAAL